MPTKITPKPAKHYKFHALKLNAWPRIQTVVAIAAVRNLQESLDLLSSPLVWIQGDYAQEHIEVFTGKYDKDGDKIEVQVPWRGCLMGAVERIDGKGELLAATILTQVIGGSLDFDDEFVPREDQREELGEKDYTFFDGSRKPDKVEEFNDHSSTTLTDVKKFLRYAIRQAERVVEFARAKKGFKLL